MRSQKQVEDEEAVYVLENVDSGIHNLNIEVEKLLPAMSEIGF